MPDALGAEEIALRLVRKLYDATEDRPQQWWSLAGMFAATDEAVQHAVDQGWLIVEGGHVCLTDHGRRRAEAR